jgi:hypothetical protein
LSKETGLGDFMIMRKMTSIPSPILPRSKDQCSLDITLFSAVEVARQLTLQDFELMFELSLNTTQLLHQSWNKPGKRERAPQICSLIDRVNKVR